MKDDSAPVETVERLIRALIAITAVAASAALWWPAPAQAARVKEVASVQGVRSNPLVGYGLVVGLDGTGDQTTSTPFTTQSLTAMLQQMGGGMGIPNLGGLLGAPPAPAAPARPAQPAQPAQQAQPAQPGQQAPPAR